MEPDPPPAGAFKSPFTVASFGDSYSTTSPILGPMQEPTSSCLKPVNDTCSCATSSVNTAAEDQPQKTTTCADGASEASATLVARAQRRRQALERQLRLQRERFSARLGVAAADVPSSPAAPDTAPASALCTKPATSGAAADIVGYTSPPAVPPISLREAARAARSARASLIASSGGTVLLCAVCRETLPPGPDTGLVLLATAQRLDFDRAAQFSLPHAGAGGARGAYASVTADVAAGAAAEPAAQEAAQWAGLGWERRRVVTGLARDSVHPLPTGGHELERLESGSVDESHITKVGSQHFTEPSRRVAAVADAEREFAAITAADTAPHRSNKHRSSSATSTGTSTSGSGRSSISGSSSSSGSYPGWAASAALQAQRREALEYAWVSRAARARVLARLLVAAHTHAHTHVHTHVHTHTHAHASNWDSVGAGAAAATAFLFESPTLRASVCAAARLSDYTETTPFPAPAPASASAYAPAHAPAQASSLELPQTAWLHALTVGSHGPASSLWSEPAPVAVSCGHVTHAACARQLPPGGDCGRSCPCCRGAVTALIPAPTAAALPQCARAGRWDAGAGLAEAGAGLAGVAVGAEVFAVAPALAPTAASPDGTERLQQGEGQLGEDVGEVSLFARALATYVHHRINPAFSDTDAEEAAPPSCTAQRRHIARAPLGPWGPLAPASASAPAAGGQAARSAAAAEWARSPAAAAALTAAAELGAGVLPWRAAEGALAAARAGLAAAAGAGLAAGHAAAAPAAVAPVGHRSGQESRAREPGDSVGGREARSSAAAAAASPGGVGADAAAAHNAVAGLLLVLKGSVERAEAAARPLAGAAVGVGAAGESALRQQLRPHHQHHQHQYQPSVLSQVPTRTVDALGALFTTATAAVAATGAAAAAATGDASGATGPVSAWASLSAAFSSDSLHSQHLPPPLCVNAAELLVLCLASAPLLAPPASRRVQAVAPESWALGQVPGVATVAVGSGAVAAVRARAQKAIKHAGSVPPLWAYFSVAAPTTHTATSTMPESQTSHPEPLLARLSGPASCPWAPDAAAALAGSYALHVTQAALSAVFVQDADATGALGEATGAGAVSADTAEAARSGALPLGAPAAVWDGQSGGGTSVHSVHGHSSRGHWAQGHSCAMSRALHAAAAAEGVPLSALDRAILQPPVAPAPAPVAAADAHSGLVEALRALARLPQVRGTAPFVGARPQLDPSAEGASVRAGASQEEDDAYVGSLYTRLLLLTLPFLRQAALIAAAARASPARAALTSGLGPLATIAAEALSAAAPVEAETGTVSGGMKGGVKALDEALPPAVLTALLHALPAADSAGGHVAASAAMALAAWRRGEDPVTALKQQQQQQQEQQQEQQEQQEVALPPAGSARALAAEAELLCRFLGLPPLLAMLTVPCCTRDSARAAESATVAAETAVGAVDTVVACTAMSWLSALSSAFSAPAPATGAVTAAAAAAAQALTLTAPVRPSLTKLLLAPFSARGGSPQAAVQRLLLLVLPTPRPLLPPELAPLPRSFASFATAAAAAAQQPARHPALSCPTCSAAPHAPTGHHAPAAGSPSSPAQSQQPPLLGPRLAAPALCLLCGAVVCAAGCVGCAPQGAADADPFAHPQPQPQPQPQRHTSGAVVTVDTAAAAAAAVAAAAGAAAASADTGSRDECVRECARGWSTLLAHSQRCTGTAGSFLLLPPPLPSPANPIPALSPPGKLRPVPAPPSRPALRPPAPSPAAASPSPAAVSSPPDASSPPQATGSPPGGMAAVGAHVLALPTRSNTRHAAATRAYTSAGPYTTANAVSPGAGTELELDEERVEALRRLLLDCGAPSLVARLLGEGVAYQQLFR